MKTARPFSDRSEEDSIELLEDPDNIDPHNRVRAALSLGVSLMGSPRNAKVLVALTKAARGDPDAGVRRQAMSCLVYQPDDAAFYALDDIARGPESTDRSWAIELLRKLGSPKGRRWFVKLAKRYGLGEEGAERLYDKRRELALTTVQAVARDHD